MLAHLVARRRGVQEQELDRIEVVGEEIQRRQRHHRLVGDAFVEVADNAVAAAEDLNDGIVAPSDAITRAHEGTADARVIPVLAFH